MDKHSSLLRTFVNYGRKKFYNIGPWNEFSTSDALHLRCYEEKLSSLKLKTRPKQLLSFIPLGIASLTFTLSLMT